MTVVQLHKLTGDLIVENKGNIDVCIDFTTFVEHENGAILEIHSAEVRRVQGADDAGPVGPKFNMLVLDGGCRE